MVQNFCQLTSLEDITVPNSAIHNCYYGVEDRILLMSLSVCTFRKIPEKQETKGKKRRKAMDTMVKFRADPANRSKDERNDVMRGIFFFLLFRAIFCVFLNAVQIALRCGWWWVVAGQESMTGIP